MTDLRARRVATQLSQGLPVIISRKEMRSYHKKMLELLQEREERNCGCKYCTGVVLNVVDETTAFEAGFNYCPMCGRKLKTAMPEEEV